MEQIFFTGVLGVIVTSIALAIARPLLLRGAVIDVPNHRSSHCTPTVRAGGAAVAVGVTSSLLVVPAGVGDLGASLVVIAVVLGLFTALGLAEDLVGLSISVRLIGQFGLATVLTMGLAATHGLAGGFTLLAGAVGTVFFVNVSNFMDGVNAISGLHGLITGLYFVLVGISSGSEVLALTGIAVASSFGAFLPWNAHRARIFLGDAGSYLLGASMVALCLLAIAAGVNAIACFAPLAIYSADVVRTLLIRRTRGEKLTAAHRDHVYQQVQRLSSSHLISASWTTLLTVTCCVIAWTSVGAPERQVGSLALIGVVIATYLATPWLLGRSLKKGAGQ